MFRICARRFLVALLFVYTKSEKDIRTWKNEDNVQVEIIRKVPGEIIPIFYNFTLNSFIYSFYSIS